VRRAELALPGGIDDVAAQPRRSGAAARALLDARGPHGTLRVRGGRFERAAPPAALRAGLLVHTTGRAYAEQGGRSGCSSRRTPAPSACSNVKAVVRIVVK
jgi:hypothetical protein